VALQALVERLPDLALAGPVKRRRTTTIRGPLSLPVRVR
jgi:cytochrome P450